MGLWNEASLTGLDAVLVGLKIALCRQEQLRKASLHTHFPLAPLLRHNEPPVHIRLLTLSM